jgi:penicillin-binding protein 1C
LSATDLKREHILDRFPNWVKWGLAIVIVPFLLFLAIDRMYPLAADVHYSHIVLDKNGRVLHGFLSRDEKWRMYTELNEISPDIKKAFLTKEDRYFYYHPGINPAAILRAAWFNSTSGRRTSGASTITMQVARMMEPKDRTYLNKFREMFRAIQLEWHLSKDEILQLYLNRVPYGGNIEGIKAASLIYFGRLPDQLSLAQIVTLTIIPNKPNQLTIGRNNSLIQMERDRWIKRFNTEGVFDDQRSETALAEPFVYRRLDVPRRAPHFSLRMRRQYPDRFTIHSSLDNEIQSKVENLLYAANRRMRFRGIRQASAIVIDNRTMQVLAYVGSPDFNDDIEAGQIDGIRAVRSPGSTLKPLIYALAVDLGLVTPKTMVADVPIHIDGYSPENYDSKYNGAVTIEDALAYSLNIPAVKTLQQIGVPTLVDKLIEADFRQVLIDRNKLGLSIALGGCGTRLEELALLYAAFANKGMYSKANWLQADSLAIPKRLISEEASYLITESLTRLTRPDLPNSASASLRVPKVAWKTGTSYGRRDAWSIGYNQNFTIAVWAGNFNNEGVPDLSGAEIATPILFDLFNTIDYASSNQWYSIPPNVMYRFVCPVTGHPRGERCEHSVVDWYIPGVSTNTTCNHLIEVSVSPEERISYCTRCRPSVGYKKGLYPDFPPDLLAWMERVGARYDKIPVHNPACTRILDTNPPRIVSPSANQEYIIDRADDAEIKLSAEAAPDVNRLYWYVNNRLIGTSKPGEDLFTKVEPGRVKISCTDDRGRNSDITFTVSFF